MLSGDHSEEKGRTNLENNDVSWVVVNIIISVDAVPNIVDTERVEIIFMWPVINDTLEPLEQYIVEFSSYKGKNNVNMPRRLVCKG
jgi:hypothetical protein